MGEGEAQSLPSNYLPLFHYNFHMIINWLL